MYNLSGLYYKLILDIAIFGGGLLFLAIIDKIWKKNKYLFILYTIIGSFVFLSFVIYDLYAIFDLNVSIHEGELVEQRRCNTYFLTNEYVFSNFEGRKPIYYMDVFSKKKIYPYDMEEGVMYTITYDDRTNFILKIEIKE